MNQTDRLKDLERKHYQGGREITFDDILWLIERARKATDYERTLDEIKAALAWSAMGVRW